MAAKSELEVEAEVKDGRCLNLYMPRKPGEPLCSAGNCCLILCLFVPRVIRIEIVG